MKDEGLLEEIKRKTQELSNPFGTDSTSSFHVPRKEEEEFHSPIELYFEKEKTIDYSKMTNREWDNFDNKNIPSHISTSNISEISKSSHSFSTSLTKGFLGPDKRIQEILMQKETKKIAMDNIKKAGKLTIFPRFKANFQTNNYSTDTDLQPKNNHEETNEEILKDELLNFNFDNALRPKNNEIGTKESEILLEQEKEPNNSDKKEEKIHNRKKEKKKHKPFFLMFLLFLFYTFLGAVIIFFTLRFVEKKSTFYLSREDITLALNASYQTEVIVNQKIVNNQNYEWTSSDSSIVTVDENGIITAINKGKATITVKSKTTDQEKEFIVNTVNVTITSIRFEQKQINLTLKEEITLAPIINEEKNIVASLSWTSDNEKIVQVDQNGHIIAVGIGEAKVSAYDEDSNLKASITVKVKKDNKKHTSNSTVSVSGISLDKESASIKIGESLSVSATIHPSNATNKEILWTSNDSNVATVENGNITAIKEGIAIITATTQDGKKTAFIQITVESISSNIPVTEISLDTTNLTLTVGESKTITANILPTNATNQDIEWKTDAKNDSITMMKAANTLTITAKKTGISIITVISSDGKYEATCIVTVKPVEDSSTNSNENQNSTSISNGTIEKKQG